MQSREKKILKNSLIFTVGNLGSKVFSYVMVLVYTYYISSAELGYYDIVLTTISLLQPVVLLSFDEGIYRWLIDAEERNIKKIISTCVKTILCSTLFAVAIFGILNLRLNVQYAIDIVFLFVSALIYQLVLNAVRGLGNNKLYALSGVLNSFFLLSFEVVGIIILRMGVEALLVSKVIANFLTVLFIYIKEARMHGLLRESADRKLIKDMTHYTVPLIPNSISWWIVNSSDRYIILAFLGASFNGIYSVANKFPTVISTISSILYFALQEAVIKEYNAPDRDKFYSNIFEKYYLFLFGLVLCGIPSTQIVIMNFVGAEYVSAWKYCGFLFISTVFAALSSFLGIGYQISKETSKSMVTTIVAALTNIIINIVLINIIGLQAASLSTCVSYIVLFFIRIIHSRKYFGLKINWKKFFIIFIASLAYMILMLFENIYIAIIALTIGIVYMSYTNKEYLMGLTKKIRGM